MQQDELAAWLRLLLTPGVGNQTARRLLALCGLPQHIFGQPAVWQGHVNAAQATALRREPADLPALVQATWQWLHSPAGDGVARRILTLADSAYPRALLATDDPPLLLHAMGMAEVLAQDQPFAALRCVAMVGSRTPTAQGLQHAHQFGRALREAGCCVVSGMALGIDAAAHEGALADAPAHTLATVAVVGTGLDRVYPARHHALAQRIARQGLLLSEFPLGTPALAHHFPKRNRIIAGLAQGTLVVEAALKSGSLITARLAAEQGREVFAIPGSIHAPQVRGCHALIRQGATLVETVQDIVQELPPQELLTPDDRPAPQPFAAPTAAAPAPAECAAPDDANPLLRALGWDPMGLDALQARTGMDTATLQARLLEHELAGDVARLPGGRFQRLGRA
jgi:DNA processing protein